MILAGDLGGTKSNLGLFDVQNDKLVQTAFKRYASQQHKGLPEMIRDFLAENPQKITAAAFGIAGPVVNNSVHSAANIPWGVDGAEIESLLGIKFVRLLNDLEAMGYGVKVLKPNELETIHPGVPEPDATQVVLAAGTGLGEAILLWDGERHRSMATEGGHADFAPQTDQQADLWKFLKARNEYASCEQILSGRGFQHLHEFLNPNVRHPGFDDGSEDPAPEITRQALEGTCPVCVAAMDLWVEIYGSEAGNFAIRALARGGIYVGGGIAVKVLPKLKNGKFAAAAARKEKMTDFLAQVPIYVILNEECPLLGAAYAAWKSF